MAPTSEIGSGTAYILERSTAIAVYNPKYVVLPLTLQTLLGKAVRLFISVMILVFMLIKTPFRREAKLILEKMLGTNRNNSEFI